MLNQQKLSILSSCSNEKDQQFNMTKKNIHGHGHVSDLKFPCLKPDGLYCTAAYMFHVYCDFYPVRRGCTHSNLQLFLEVAQF